MNPPKELGKYIIESNIGQGEMGAVYKAHDRTIDRVVAIKILHSHLLKRGSSLDFQQRFSNEIKAAARCFHQNIVTVFDCGIFEDAPYMVMEYVKGIDLRRLLECSETIPVNQSIDIILKVLDALQFAHETGVVHRDIKPANIMLLDNGQVKVTDFGVAHIDTSDLTKVGDVMGTPCYMAPEASQAQTVDNRSDIYTTAIVLIELLTGKRPQIYQLHEKGIFKLLSQSISNRTKAKKLSKVLACALNYDPDLRYQKALEFSKALSQCRNSIPHYHQMEKSLAQTVLHAQTSIRLAKIKNQVENSTHPSKASPTSIHSDQLTIMENNLTSYIGPIAKVLVKKYSKSVNNLDHLISSLASQIPSESERQQFISHLASSGVHKIGSAFNKEFVSEDTTQAKSSTPLALSDQAIEQLTSDLIDYLGPIANLIVKKAVKNAASLKELHNLLAQKIHNEDERKTFLKNCSKRR